MARVSTQRLAIDVSDGTIRTHSVDDDAVGHHRLSLEPPLRRWAARRALRGDPTRLGDLRRCAGAFEPRHRGALIHGLLDASGALDEARRRVLVHHGLQTAQSGVRRAALDHLCELDGVDQALRRARADSDASVRKWQPRHPEPPMTPSLFAT